MLYITGNNVIVSSNARVRVARVIPYKKFSFMTELKIEDWIININLYQYIHKIYIDNIEKYADYRVDVSRIYTNYIKSNGTIKNKFLLMKGAVSVDSIKPYHFWGDRYYNLISKNYDNYHRYNKKPIYNYWYVLSELSNWCQNSKCQLCTFYYPLFPNYNDVQKCHPLLNKTTINVIYRCQKIKENQR